MGWHLPPLENERNWYNVRCRSALRDRLQRRGRIRTAHPGRDTFSPVNQLLHIVSGIQSVAYGKGSCATALALLFDEAFPTPLTTIVV